MPRAVEATASTHASATPTALDGAWRAGCDRCGALYTLSAWLRLAEVAQVEPAWLATHVTGWHTDDVVEVRRCGRCTNVMSRRRPSKTDR